MIRVSYKNIIKNEYLIFLYNNMNPLNIIQPKQKVSFSLTITNLLKLFAMFSPLITLFFIIIYSIFTSNILKTLFLIIGSILIILLSYFLKKIIKETQSKYASLTCNFFPKPFSYIHDKYIYTSPSTNTAMLSYIFMYIVYPMKERNNYDYGLILFLFGMLILNSIYELFEYCSSTTSIVLAFLLGITMGLFNYILLKRYDKTFFNFTSSLNEIKDNTKCYFSTNNEYICNEMSDYKVSNKDFTNLIILFKIILVFAVIFYMGNMSIKMILAQSNNYNKK
tara:strand:+ start:662 stop:1501 length:840 start_codon:yes stop_codon:yes gene_type:complete